MLDTIHDAMLEKARKHRDAHTYTAAGWDEFVDTVNNKPGFVKADVYKRQRGHRIQEGR